MFQKRTLFVVGLISLLSAGCSQASTTSSNTNQIVSQSAPTDSGKVYKLADISSHNNQSSCWTTINGEVYDITAYIPKHPGGAAQIMKVCGKDGTAAFMGQHGNNQKPQTTLEKFKIGTLAK